MTSKEYFYEFGKLIYKVDGFYAEYAKKFDIKENLLWILYALNDGKDHSQKEICDSWDIPRSTVNTITKELEGEGYVALSQIKGEKRELSLMLTDKGKKYAESLLCELYEIEALVFEKIKEKTILHDLKEIEEELNKSRKVIEK